MSALRRWLRRFYMMELTHRIIPLRAARWLVMIRARCAWTFSAAVRADARKAMHFLLGESVRAGDVEACARRYVLETCKRSEIRFRPGLLEAVAATDNLTVLRAAHATGRGVILSYLHHGHSASMYSSYANSTIPIHIPVHPDFLRSDALDFQKRTIKNLRAAGVNVFSAAGGYGYMRELLSSGEMIMLANDLPGSLPMTFLGRRVRAASGIARLAKDVNALIVPSTSHARGWLQSSQIGDPIDPSDFDTLEQLQAEIARRHEPAILAWPEAVEDPLARWFPLDASDIEEFGFQE